MNKQMKMTDQDVDGFYLRHLGITKSKLMARAKEAKKAQDEFMKDKHTYWFRYAADYGPQPGAKLIGGVISDKEWDITEWALSRVMVPYGTEGKLTQLVIIDRLTDKDFSELCERIEDQPSPDFLYVNLKVTHQGSMDAFKINPLSTH